MRSSCIAAVLFVTGFVSFHSTEAAYEEREFQLYSRLLKSVSDHTDEIVERLRAAVDEKKWSVESRAEYQAMFDSVKEREAAAGSVGLADDEQQCNRCTVGRDRH